MFQLNGKKGLKKSHVNLDDDRDLTEFKKTLGHLAADKTKKNTSSSAEPESMSHVTIHSGGQDKKVKLG